MATATPDGAVGVPEPLPRVRLALKKSGQLTCRHFYRLVQTRDRMYLKCDFCDRETVGVEFDEPVWFR